MDDDEELIHFDVADYPELVDYSMTNENLSISTFLELLHHEGYKSTVMVIGDDDKTFMWAMSPRDFTMFHLKWG